MSAFYDLSKTPRNILNQAIVRAIVSENNGALFDPSDLSTLYQDAAGTIPVTAVEQPVGKMLDKSGNGYHATQPITASQPTLSARYNLGLSTEDIRSGYTFNAGGTAVSAQTVACDATNNAGIRMIEFNLSSGSIKQAARVGTFSFGCELRKSAGSAISSVYFSVDQGNCTVSADTAPSGAITLTDSWVKYNGTVTISAVGTVWRVWVYRAGAAPTGNFDIKNIHINEGATLLHYQRVNTSTYYDTDERYFPKYLKFSSTVALDDFMNLPYMGLYANGSASIVCARDAVSQSNDTYIISERLTTDADPKYFPSRQLANGGNMDAYISDNAGTVVLDTTGSAFSGASDAVVRSVIDTGNNIKLLKNGQLVANDNYIRAGALTLNNTTIGASVSTTTSNYVVMKLYGLIITKSALTDSQRMACERHLGRKSGVQL